MSSRAEALVSRALKSPSPIGLVAVVSALLSAVALVAWLTFSHFSGLIEGAMQQDLQAVASAQKAGLESYIGERFEDAELLVQRPPVWQMLSAQAGPVHDAAAAQALEQRLRQTEKAYGYYQVRILDRSLRTAGPPLLEPLQPVEQAALEAAMSSRQRSLVDIHQCAGHSTCFGVAHPVFENGDASRAVTGAAYLEMDAAEHLSRVGAQWLRQARTAESYLVRREGDDIVYLTPLRYAPSAAPLGVRRSVRMHGFAAVAAAVASGPVVAQGDDYRGVEVVGAAVPIAGTPWILLAKIDRAEVRAPIRTLGLSVLAIAIFLLILLAAGGMLAWRGRRSAYLAAQAALDRRYRVASQESLNGYAVLDAYGRFLEVNDALVALTGYTHDELHGMRVQDVEARLTPQQVDHELVGLRRTGKARWQTRWRRKDGSALELEVSTTFLEDAGGGAFYSFMRDIGPELAARRRIEYLNAFYAFLSHANAAIFNLRSTQGIVEAVCAGAVQDGGFLLAWAGVTDEAAGRVRPTFAYGAAADYVKSLVITTDPALPTSHGPTRTCMVERQIVYVDDFQSDGRTAPWRELAAKYGLRSSASVPILVDGNAVAAMTFYSGEPHHFVPELRDLLAETARNVSLAWQSAQSQQAREAAEAARRSSEERFRRVFDAAPMPIQIHSLSTRGIRAINAAHARVFGYAAQDIADEAGWFDRAYADPAVRAQVRQVWNDDVRQAAAGGPGTVVRGPEVRLRCKDGGERLARRFLTVAGDDIIVQWEDLTDIRRSETRLVESERRFRGMVEQTLTGVYVAQDNRVAYVNPRIETIMGYATAELVGRNPLDFVEPAARERAGSVQSRLDAGEISVNASFPVVRKDGRVIELGVHATHGTWDGAPALIVMAQDISERKHAEEKIAAYVKQLEGTMRGTLQAVANMVEMRDPYTSGHERRVGLIAADIAREIGWPEDRCGSLQLIGLVHDIGKIAVPAEILSKPSQLSPVERAIVRSHAEKGYEILKDLEFPLPIAETIRQHHERMDGSGYPRGLKGEDILPEARIIAVADVLESMASHRPYRPAVGMEAALKELGDHRGSWFDPLVVDAARRLILDKHYQLPA
ncbi:MAG: PAS domain S-box protein [Nevskia sp.]|nr:PAS domain S-box protein [Nevskia sp.]